MDIGAYCPFDSMVREPCGCIIGDASAGAIPLGRLSIVRDSLRRCAYTAILEAVMSRGKSGAEPAGLSRVNLNAAGIDVGATSHFVAVPADRAEQSVREFEAFTDDLYRLVVPPGRLADGVPGGDRGHGVHRSLLDTPIRYAGGAGV